MTSLARGQWLQRRIIAGPAALVIILALIATLTALEFERGRPTTPSGPGTLSEIASRQLAGVNPAVRFLGSQGAGALTVWGLKPVRHGVRVLRWDLDGTGTRPVAPATLNLPVAPGPAVVTEGADGPPVLIIAHSRRLETEVQSFSLGLHPRLLAESMTHIPPLPGGTERQIAPALLGTGRLLLVVDRALSGAVTVAGYRGPLGAGALVRFRRPRLGFPRRVWALAITAGSAPIALDWLTRGATASGRTELHALPSSDQFASFGEQATTPFRDAQPGLEYAVACDGDGAPVLLTIDPQAARVSVLSLIPKASGS